MVSNLVTRGYGVNSHIISRGYGPLTVTIIPVVPTVSRGGGGSSIVIPEALVVAEIRINIKHVPRFVRYFQVKTNHIELFEKLPIKIRHVILQLSARVLGMSVNSIIQGLSLKMTNEGLNIDDSQS